MPVAQVVGRSIMQLPLPIEVSCIFMQEKTVFKKSYPSPSLLGGGCTVSSSVRA